MKFFVDTANLEQIKEAQALGILDGVTTNPSLMAKEGIVGYDNVMSHYRTICELVDGDISAEVIATDYDGIIKEGQELADLHPNIVVKVPMTIDGIKAIRWFSDNDIKQIAHSYSLLVKPFLRQKRELLIFLHLLVE